MRSFSLRLFPIAILALLPFTVAAQDSTMARRGDMARLTTYATDSVMDGRLAWISADSLSVWRVGALRTLPIAGVRTVHVRRRPPGYAERTIVTAAALGVIGGVVGARLVACHRAGAPAGAVDFSCDTPNTATRPFAVMGFVVGSSLGWLAQAVHEPNRWIPARIAR